MTESKTIPDSVAIDGLSVRRILDVLEGVARLVEAGEVSRDQMILLTDGKADSRMGYIREVDQLGAAIRSQLPA